MNTEDYNKLMEIKRLARLMDDSFACEALMIVVDRHIDHYNNSLDSIDGFTESEEFDIVVNVEDVKIEEYPAE